VEVTVTVAGILVDAMHRGNQKDSARLVYFDTSMWNALCDQDVEGQQLLAGLSERGFRVGLGTNAVYEMAKTFEMSKPDAIERGKKLFSYLKQYTDRSVPCIRETWDLLQREGARAMGETAIVDVCWNTEEYAALSKEVEKLACGVFDDNAKRFVERRKTTARSVPDEIQNHLASRPAQSRILRGITEDELRRWINRELTRTPGRRALQGHLAMVFQRKPDRQLTQLAKRLLAGVGYKVAHALVRSDLYLNWRCARRGSLRRDLPDDTYHAVNACYCQSFVTTERDQAEHAAYTNPTATTCVYEGSKPLQTWLLQSIDS
jgi:hypothetical protein